MKAIFKVVLWVIIAVILLLALALAAVVFWFNPNNYKTQIAAQVSSATGRQLTINGDIAWSLWPNIGFKISNATLSNPAGFSQAAFAKIASANVSVKLLPLLSKQIEINTVNIVGLKLTLIQKSASLNNWTFNNTAAATSATTNQHSAGDNYAAQVNMHISQLRIDNASVQFIDEIKHHTYQVQNFSFKGNNLGFGQAFPISMAFIWQSNMPKASGQLSLTADAAISVAEGQYTLDNLKLVSNVILAKADSAKPLIINTDLAGKLKLDLPSQILTLNANVLLNKLLTLNARLQVKQLLGDWQYAGDLKASAKSLVDVLRSLNIVPPSLPNSQALTDFAMNTQFNGDQQHIIIPSLSVSLYQSNLQGNVDIKQFAMPQIALDLNLNQINVADYANLYGALLPINGVHAQANLTAKGWDKPTLTHTLNGKVFTSVQQATLQGLDIPAMLRGVNSAINSLFKNGDIAAALHTLQQQLPVFDGKQNTIYPHSGKQTQFTAFSSNSVIVNGVLTNTLALTGQQFHMQGGGTLDFTRKNYIDYTLSAALLQDNAGNAGNAIHMQVPFKITGTPQALNYGVDMGPIETQLTEIFVKKVQNAAKQQLENAAGAAGSLLQNLIAK